MSFDYWHKVLRVNLSGSFYMSKPAIEHMLERGSGRIIFISSVTGETGNIGQSNYAASKSGLFGLTKTLAREAALASGCPGSSTLGWGSRSMPHAGPDRDRHGGHDPSVSAEQASGGDSHASDGQPEEVARVVCFLAQDASAYITGQIWGVNGGYDM